MQPEARITKAIRLHLESIGAFVFKVHGGPQMMAGLPDLIACYKGYFIGIEVKQPGNGPSERQKFVMQQIKRAKGICIVATQVADVYEPVRVIDEHCDYLAALLTP